MTNPINPIETLQALVREALDALGEAVSDAESCGHPMGGRVAVRRARESREAAETAVRTLGDALLAQMQSQPSDEPRSFMAWAESRGYDIAHAYDTDRSCWVFWNPMTADLWTAWQAACALGPVKAQQEPVAWRFERFGLPDETAWEREWHTVYSDIEPRPSDQNVRNVVPLYPSAHQGAQPAVPFDPEYVCGYLEGVLEEATGNADPEVRKLLDWLTNAAAPSASAQPQEGSNNG